MPAPSATEIDVTSTARATSHRAAQRQGISRQMMGLIQQQPLQAVNRHPVVKPARHGIDVHIPDAIPRAGPPVMSIGNLLESLVAVGEEANRDGQAQKRRCLPPKPSPTSRRSQ